MPGEIIDRPNPQPLTSHIPDQVNELAVKLEKIAITENDIKGLEDFRRASNYIAAGELSAFHIDIRSSTTNVDSNDLSGR